MKTRILKQTSVIVLAVIAALTVTLSFASGLKVEEKQSSSSSNARERTIVGVWRTRVTPRNCQTGDPVAPAFPGIFMFNIGGTMDAYGIGPGSSPALVS
ncbi:MAG: hypothetical protein M3371_15955, partial [Acidobacteriota bacterium]|nr:hypothetical protein [Acidobacteriota bacterium]